MQLTKALNKDLKKIQELNLLLFEKEFQEYDATLDTEWTFGKPGEKYFRDRIKAGLVWIMRLDGKGIGYLAGTINTPPWRKSIVGEIENMFVLLKFRGRGIGTKLMRAFITECRTRKVTIVRSTFAAGNASAEKFYEKFGMKNYEKTAEGNIKTI